MRWMVAVLIVRNFVVGCECAPSFSGADASVLADAGLDAGVTPDAGLGDAGVPDAGPSDAGMVDAGVNDAGAGDAGADDAGAFDSGFVSLFDAGTLDLAFGDGGMVTFSLSASDQAFGIAVQADGRVVAIGTSATYTQFGVLRLNVDGSPDPTFDNTGARTFNLGTSTTDLPFCVRILPDGHLVIVGSSKLNSTLNQVAVVQLKTDGSFEPTFGSTGPGYTVVPIGGVDDNTARLEIAPDGKLVLGGFIGPPNGDYTVTRLMPNGQLDLSFRDAGYSTFVTAGADTQTGLTLQPNGNIVVSGETDQKASMVRFDGAGAVDTTFGDGGLVIDDLTPGFESKYHAVLAQPDGKLVTIGYMNGAIVIARYDATGARDPNFGANGYLSLSGGGQAFGGYLDWQGRVVFVGRQNNQFIVGRVLTSGALDTSFGTLGTGYQLIDFGGTNQFGFTAAEAPNRQIVVAGMSSDRFALARLWP